MKTIRQVCTGVGLTAALTFLFSTVSYANDNASLVERLDKLEKKQKRLEKKVKKNRKKTGKKIAELKKRVSFNGFFSAGFATASEDINASLFDQFSGVDEDVCTDCYTTLGIQMTFKVDDKTDVVGQFISEGATNRELKTDWGYLKHKINDNLQVSAGRMVTPYYMKSQYQTVNFALPWAEPPPVYITSVRYFDGIDLKYSFSSGNFDGSALVFYGSSKTSEAALDFGLDDLKGIVLEGGFGHFRFSLGVHNGSFFLVDGERDAQTTAVIQGLDAAGARYNLTTDDSDTNYLTLGFEYDDGVNLVLAEYANLTLDDTLVTSVQSGYITYGRRINSWMPYITYGKLESLDEHDDRIESVQASIATTQEGLGTLITAAQQMLLTVDGTDPVADQQTLATIAQLTGDETLIAAVNAGIIDAHDMVQVVAGLGSTITDLGTLSAGLGIRKDIQQTLYSIGVKKTITPKIVVKAEYSLFTDFGDGTSFGVFESKTDDDDVELYTIVLTAVF